MVCAGFFNMSYSIWMMMMMMMAGGHILSLGQQNSGPAISQSPLREGICTLETHSGG